MLREANPLTRIFGVSAFYARQSPNVQQTLDLFKGSWASGMPCEFAQYRAGKAQLFEDPRVGWAAEKLESLGVAVRGAKILELGPLEGGHTYSLAKLGADSVTAVEANSEAFLKCLITKELLGVQRVNFLFGDAVSFLQECGYSYDVIFACGFLYHMANPAELIELMCRRARSVFLWSVYFDRQFAEANPQILCGNGPSHRAAHKGFVHTLHRHDYGTGLSYSKFWGGPTSYANWMEGNEILDAFKFFGFGNIVHEFESNPNGAALRMVASRC